MTKKQQEPLDTTDLYKQHPEIFAAFILKDGKLVFDYDENRIEITELMLILNTTITEYLKAIHINTVQQKNEEKETTNGKK